jgi:hypothetical protein
MQKPLWWIKLTRYEYWPVWLFFLPGIFIFWPLLAIRARALLYFTATNPGIPLGGFFGEKKYDIIKDINPKYLPQTLLIKYGDIPQAIKLITDNGFTYPLILKPNVGERGNDVAKVDNQTALLQQLANYTGDVIVQEFITHPEEYGVMFYKFQDGKTKGISSIVKKGFLTATGDGKSTLRQLMQKNVRDRFQLPTLEEKPDVNLDEVLPNGQKHLVEPIGNHCRGTAFIDGNKLITNQMIAAFDDIAGNMPGFYFGRFDIKAPSDEALQNGEGIKVMEVNGTTSEPGHIYDLSTMNIFTAYRDIWRSMKIINDIAIQNHRKFGVPYSTKKEFLTTLYGHFFKKTR